VSTCCSLEFHRLGLNCLVRSSFSASTQIHCTPHVLHIYRTSSFPTLTAATTLPPPPPYAAPARHPPSHPSSAQPRTLIQQPIRRSLVKCPYTPQHPDNQSPWAPIPGKFNTSQKTRAASRRVPRSPEQFLAPHALSELLPSPPPFPPRFYLLDRSLDRSIRAHVTQQQCPPYLISPVSNLRTLRK